MSDKETKQMITNKTSVWFMKVKNVKTLVTLFILKKYQGCVYLLSNNSQILLTESLVWLIFFFQN